MGSVDRNGPSMVLSHPHTDRSIRLTVWDANLTECMWSCLGYRVVDGKHGIEWYRIVDGKHGIEW